MTENDNTADVLDAATPHIEQLIALTRRLKDDPRVSQTEFEEFVGHVEALKELRERATLPGLKAGLDQSLAELSGVIEHVQVHGGGAQ